MINYPYYKVEALINPTYKIIKKKLDEEHEHKKQHNKALHNTKRKILEEDVKLIMTEFFKDLAIWLEEPNTTLYGLGDLGQIKINHIAIDAFISNTLIPKLRIELETKDITRKRFQILWNIRQLKYAPGSNYFTSRTYKDLEIIRANREPNLLYGDAFDVRLPKLEKRLISYNLDRKEFLDILYRN